MQTATKVTGGRVVVVLISDFVLCVVHFSHGRKGHFNVSHHKNLRTLTYVAHPELEVAFVVAVPLVVLETYNRLYQRCLQYNAGCRTLGHLRSPSTTSTTTAEGSEEKEKRKYCKGYMHGCLLYSYITSYS